MAARQVKKVKGQRRFFRFLLVVMLVISLCMAVFSYHLTHDPGNPANTTQIVGESGVAVATDAAPAPMPARKWDNGPDWRGQVTVKKAEDGSGSDIIVDALDKRGFGVALTSFDIVIYPPGKEKEPLPATFEQEAPNRIKGHIKLPAKGEVIMRVRLHRDNSTMEFSERIAAE